MVREGRVKRDRLRGNCLGLVARAGIGVVLEEPREGGVFIQSRKSAKIISPTTQEDLADTAITSSPQTIHDWLGDFQLHTYLSSSPRLWWYCRTNFHPCSFPSPSFLP